MALEAWALATVPELQDELESPQASARLVPRLESLLNRATSIIEEYTYRRLISRSVDLVEFQSIPPDLFEMYTLDYPIISVIDLREDVSQAYGATTILDAAALAVVKGNPEGTSRGKITRLYDTFWLPGYRTYQLTYRAGFASRAAVPYGLKDICLSLAALRFREIERKAQGEVVKTDPTGGTMKLMDRGLTTAHLTDSMKDQLQPWVREDLYPTGERAA